MLLNVRPLFILFRDTYRKWRSDNAAGYAASLSYYALFAIVPLLLVVIATAGAIFGRVTVKIELFHYLADTFGQDVAEFVTTALSHTDRSRNVLAAIVSLVLTFMGSIGIFGQLRKSLNMMWRAPARPWRGWLRAILPSFGLFLLVLFLGFIFILTAITSTVLTTLARNVDESLFDVSAALFLFDIVASLLFTTLIIWIIYRVLPNIRLPGKMTILGALVTAIFLTIGKVGLNIFLHYSTIISVYGAARAVIILLLFVYYSAQIFYMGAEFTYVYATKDHTLPAPQK